uniref:Related to peroxisomal membrane protein Pex17 n=1 Tax=Ramularia collo-cygni TaxID=112498 RepID=A0A2D3UM73_9PEZI
MPGDRMLGTLLRALQTYTQQEDTPRLFGTASSLLTTLNNPLNVTLLTTQLLSAPAPERTLPKDDWIRAVVSGADEHSPRWRHLLVIAGLLLGFGPAEDEYLSSSMRSTLENALVNATNLALQETLDDDELGLSTIALVVNHCFSSLSDHARSSLDYNTLLPVLMRSTFHSAHGLRSAYFLGALDRDVQAAPNAKLNWSEQSGSFQEIKEMLSSPLVSSLGPLSRLIGHSLEQVQDSRLVTAALDDLEIFTKTLLTQWRLNKLAGIEQVEQGEHLDEATLNTTLPALWKLLQPVMFASVIIMRSILGRILGDGALACDDVAPKLARQTLLILRSLYFITTRQGVATFSQYNFVYCAAIDILNAYSMSVQHFLREIQPLQLGSVAQHPLDRNLDLFFLNTSEHFTLILPPHMTAELLVPTVTSYLAAGGKGPLLEIYEAAHSVTLSIFSSPQNSTATIENLPFYVDSLFRVFPKNLSARQFRLAFKTLLKLTSPPSELAVSQPLMPAILLELLHSRSQQASTTPIPIHPGSPEADIELPVPLSEQAVLTLTLLDTLTQIPLELLDEWLPIAADMVHDVQDQDMREHCKEHFWQILVGGELDPERSRLCHAWWSTAGGRAWVLYGRREEEGRGKEDDDGGEPMMSGALPDRNGESKL